MTNAVEGNEANWDMKKKGQWITGCKERGEWAELCFAARAAGEGLWVSLPYGDSRTYDVLVEAGGRILRVQVKSTSRRRRKNEYALKLRGPGRKSYEPGSLDFFAVYLIPDDTWYIIPYEAVGERLSLHFCPGGPRQRYAEYREAWDLLRGDGKISIQACADPLYVDSVYEDSAYVDSLYLTEEMEAGNSARNFLGDEVGCGSQLRSFP